MSKLILVKHAMPEIVPEQPASEWHLSEEGRLSCELLGRQLRVYQPEVVVASTEPKATETGEIVASLLNLPFETADGLHEHDRRNVPFYDDWQRFEREVAEFFARLGERVLGLETADEAHQRFSQAVSTVSQKYPDRTIVIVTHGTVMSIFTARHAGIEPFSLWRRLKLPSYIVFTRPQLELLALVESVSE